MVTRFNSSLFVRIFATTAVVLSALFVTMYLLAVPFIQGAVEGIEQNERHAVLNNVYAMVEQTHFDIQDYRRSVVLERKAQLRNIIAVVEARVKILEAQVRSGKLSKAQAISALLDELRHVKYGHDDYVWASDYNSVLISHPDPKLNNADFSQKRDFRGNLIVPPMVAGALATGEGFHSYWWRRLGEQEQIEKLSYYKHIAFFDLVVGTGVYLDDVEATVRLKQAAAVEKLRQQLRTIHLAKSGDVYIFDGQMKMIIHPNPNIEGKDFSRQLNPSTQTPIGQLLMAVADKQEGLRHLWDSTSDPGNYVYDKISWVRHFKGFDWYVCTSAYVKELDESARILRNHILEVFAATLLISVLLTYLFAKKLTDPLRQLSDTALRVENGDYDARCDLGRNDEIGVVATAFNGMLGRLQDNIRDLDAKIMESTDELHSLVDIGISLSSERDLNALLEKIVDAAIEITNSDGCTIYIKKGPFLYFSVSKNISQGLKVGGLSGAPSKVPPVPLTPSFVSSYVAITKKMVNIADVYTSEEFDFRGTKEYDSKMNYKTFSMLVTPLLDYQGEVIGVLQLLNAISLETGEVVSYPKKHEALAKALSGQAAVAISNVNLIRETEDLFKALMEVMATATDARSKYTHGHIRRVAGLALELAGAINEADEGPFAKQHFTDDDINELRVAGWLHDIGKIVSPAHIMDKSVKLETICDRSDFVRTRYDVIRLLAIEGSYAKKVELLKNGKGEEEMALLDEELSRELAKIDDEAKFVLACNNPKENMEDEKIGRLENIASQTYSVNGAVYPRITQNELLNLSIRKGSLTEEERKLMQYHINVTINMLEKIPFSRKLKNVLLYAGSHHECLDGSGYPKGLKADQMPIQSRMLAVVDFLEALTAADRPYKKALPMDLVWKILQSEVDKNHLDGDLLNILREKNVYERFAEKDKAVSGETAIALFAGVNFDSIPNCGTSTFAQGDFILRKGEYTDICHVIIQGQAEGLFDRAEGNPIFKEGDIVGEMALFTGMARVADIKAATPVVTLDITRDQLFAIMDKFPPVKERLDEIYRCHGLAGQLARIPLFNSIPRGFIDDIAITAELVNFQKGDVVFRQGEPADAFYILRYGSVKVESQIEGQLILLAHLKEGQYFGEVALLSDAPRTASVSATTKVEMIKVSRVGFGKILAASPGVLRELEDSMERAIENTMKLTPRTP